MREKNGAERVLRAGAARERTCVRSTAIAASARSPSKHGKRVDPAARRPRLGLAVGRVRIGCRTGLRHAGSLRPASGNRGVLRYDSTVWNRSGKHRAMDEPTRSDPLDAATGSTGADVAVPEISVVTGAAGGWARTWCATLVARGGGSGASSATTDDAAAARGARPEGRGRRRRRARPGRARHALRRRRRRRRCSTPRR